MIGIGINYASQATSFIGHCASFAKATVMSYADRITAFTSPHFKGVINFATPYAASAYSAVTYGAKATAAFVMTPTGAAITAIAVVHLIALAAIIAHRRAGQPEQKEKSKTPGYRTLARQEWMRNKRTGRNPKPFSATTSGLGLHPQLEEILGKPTPTGPPREPRTRTNTSRAHRLKNGTKRPAESSSKFSPLFLKLIFSHDPQLDSAKPSPKQQVDKTPRKSTPLRRSASSKRAATSPSPTPKVSSKVPNAWKKPLPALREAQVENYRRVCAATKRPPTETMIQRILRGDDRYTKEVADAVIKRYEAREQCAPVYK